MEEVGWRAEAGHEEGKVETTGTGQWGEPGLGLDPGLPKLEQCWRGEACELSQPEVPG